MTFPGTIRNGVIVLDPLSVPLPPDGTRVSVAFNDAPPADYENGDTKPNSLGVALLALAGSVDGLPEDLAAEHDHYLHGKPKR